MVLTKNYYCIKNIYYCIKNIRSEALIMSIC